MPSKAEINSWLDDSVVSIVGQAEPTDVEYRFTIRISDLNMELTKQSSNGPLVIVSNMRDEIDISDLTPQQRNDFLMLLENGLMSAPGIFQYVNFDSEVVDDFDEMQGVQILHKIYPEAADQQALMDAIFDISKSLVFIRDAMATTFQD
jgi:hypothetical protein